MRDDERNIAILSAMISRRWMSTRNNDDFYKATLYFDRLIA
jgi:hypothetical protein